MKTPQNPKENIETILYVEYGVGPVVAGKEVVLWAAERIIDPAKAKAELSRLNKIRAKHGAPLVYAPYGHHAF